MRQLLLLEGDAAAFGRQQAHQRLQERGLADAVAAEERRHLAGRYLKAEVAQDVAAAVVLIETANDHKWGHKWGQTLFFSFENAVRMREMGSVPICFQRP